MFGLIRKKTLLRILTTVETNSSQELQKVIRKDDRAFWEGYRSALRLTKIWANRQ